MGNMENIMTTLKKFAEVSVYTLATLGAVGGISYGLAAASCNNPGSCRSDAAPHEGIQARAVAVSGDVQRPRSFRADGKRITPASLR
jgi:hypothetical protein